jgi:hypothetical protein
MPLSGKYYNVLPSLIKYGNLKTKIKNTRGINVGISEKIFLYLFFDL